MVKTKRWNDPSTPEDGRRLLVTRYRPRGVTRDAENWDAWLPHLAPSRQLHAAAYGKGQPALPWDIYRTRYLAEMAGQRYWIDALGQHLARGEGLTLLCSSACVDSARCHRTLLAELIAHAARDALAPPRGPSSSPSTGVVRRRGR